MWRLCMGWRCGDNGAVIDGDQSGVDEAQSVGGQFRGWALQQGF